MNPKHFFIITFFIFFKISVKNGPVGTVKAALFGRCRKR